KGIMCVTHAFKGKMPVRLPGMKMIMNYKGSFRPCSRRQTHAAMDGMKKNCAKTSRKWLCQKTPGGNFIPPTPSWAPPRFCKVFKLNPPIAARIPAMIKFILDRSPGREPETPMTKMIPRVPPGFNFDQRWSSLAADFRKMPNGQWKQNKPSDSVSHTPAASRLQIR
ncbi:MAG: hypothetical protein ABSF34_21410, partial [Verrucomicrobiota bacterium]